MKTHYKVTGTDLASGTDFEFAVNVTTFRIEGSFLVLVDDQDDAATHHLLPAHAGTSYRIDVTYTEDDDSPLRLPVSGATWCGRPGCVGDPGE